MHGDTGVNTFVLQRSNELETRSVADVGQPGVSVAAEVPLVDLALFGAVEDGAPLFELTDAVCGLLSVQLGHPPLVQELAAAHGVAEVDLPVVAVVGIPEGCGGAPFGHDRVGFAEEGLAHDGRVEPQAGTFDGGAESGPASTDDDDIVVDALDLADVHLRHPRCSGR